MLKSIISWFQPPKFPEDEDKTRSALLLNVVLNTFIITIPIVFVGSILGGNIPRLAIILTIIACAWVLIIGIRFIMLAGRVALAGITLITIIFTAVTLVIYNVGTIRAPVTSFYILTIVMVLWVLLEARPRIGIIGTVYFTRKNCTSHYIFFIFQFF